MTITTNRLKLPLALLLFLPMLLVVFSLPSRPTFAQINQSGVNVYLKLDGIKGESDAPQHKDEIDIISYQQSADPTPSRGEPAAQLSFVKRVDAASPKIMLAGMTKQQIKSAVFSFTKTTNAGTYNFYKVTLTDVVITSVDVTQSGAVYPTEKVTLTFNKAKWEYWPVQSNGSPVSPEVTEWSR